MEYYPDTDYAKIAMDRIRTISSGGAPAAPEPSKKKAVEASPSDFDDFTMDDGDDVFSFDDEPANNKKQAAPAKSQASADSSFASDFSSEMDDFISDDSNDDFGDFAIDDAPAAAKKGPSTQDIFEKAEASMDMNNFSAALETFKEIMGKGKPSSPHELKFYIDSYYNAGVCCFETKDYKAAMNYFAEITKSFADSDKLKGSIFHIGRIFEAAGQADKAVVYYNKALNMSPKDSINAKAMDRIKALQKR